MEYFFGRARITIEDSPTWLFHLSVKIGERIFLTPEIYRNFDLDGTLKKGTPKYYSCK